MSQGTGGPAFPQDYENTKVLIEMNALGSIGDEALRKGTQQLSGMTLRDYFAAKAVSGILANPDISASAARCKVSTDQFRIDMASAAYAMADAMLAERDK